MGNHISPTQKRELKDALYDGLKEQIKKSLTDFMFQKSGDSSKSYASHYQKELKIIFDLYETAYDCLDEFLMDYK